MNTNKLANQLFTKGLIQVFLVFMIWNQAIVSTAYGKDEGEINRPDSINLNYPMTPTPMVIADIGNPTPTPTPTPDCCQKGITDFNWDNETTLNTRCFLNPPGDCVTSGECAEIWLIIVPEAEEFASNKFGLDDAKENAALHTYWSLSMAERYNTCVAKQITDAWEVDEPNSCGELYKDLFNNKVGRDLASQPGTKEQRVCDAMDSGDLQLNPGC